MTGQLKGTRVAILATDGFEQSELIDPRHALEDAGADTEVLSPKGGSIRGWNRSDWGEAVDVETRVSEADVSDYDALVLPGGVMNPDHLRTDRDAIAFVKSFIKAGKPVAAICHGPWMLVEAGVVSGRRLTSWPSLRTDIRNAGGEWVDEEVVVDDALITSRKPDDIPAFCAQLIEALETAQEKLARRAQPA